MNGFQVIQAVRKVNPDVKVIVTSSFEIAMKEFNIVLPSLSIDGVIEKPVRLEKLGKVVKSVERNS